MAENNVQTSLPLPKQLYTQCESPVQALLLRVKWLYGNSYLGLSYCAVYLRQWAKFESGRGQWEREIRNPCHLNWYKHRGLDRNTKVKFD